MNMSSDVVGRIGRVSGLVAPGRLGEVIVPIRGGTEAFHARCAQPDAVLAVGSRIVVVEYFPPRTVLISAAA